MLWLYPAKRFFWLYSSTYCKKPCLEIRKRFTDPADIKLIVKQVLETGHITIDAQFKDRLKAIAVLKQQKLI